MHVQKHSQLQLEMAVVYFKALECKSKQKADVISLVPTSYVLWSSPYGRLESFLHFPAKKGKYLGSHNQNP